MRRIFLNVTVVTGNYAMFVSTNPLYKLKLTV